MLMIETIILDGRQFVHNYSDEGFKIKRNDGVIFDEAIDIINSNYTYEEVIPEDTETTEN